MSLLVTMLVASGVCAQAPDPRLVPAEEEPPAVNLLPAETAALALKPQTGWARAGGRLGFGLAAVPLGLVIGAIVASYQVGQLEQELLLIAAGLSTPLMGLVPTLAGRSAVVDDAHAGKPRLLRIIGWGLVGLSAAGLVVSPVIARGLQFLKLSTGKPSILGSTLNLIDGVIAAAAVVVLSISALQSAKAAEASTFEPQIETSQLAPVVSYLPGRGLMAGVAGTF